MPCNSYAICLVLGRRGRLSGMPWERDADSLAQGHADASRIDRGNAKDLSGDTRSKADAWQCVVNAWQSWGYKEITERERLGNP